jgi:hypothetical protein
MNSNRTTTTLTVTEVAALEAETEALYVAQAESTGIFIPAPSTDDDELLDGSIARALRYLGMHIPEEHVFQEV